MQPLNREEMRETGVAKLKEISPKIDKPEERIDKVLTILEKFAIEMDKALKENKALTSEERLLLVGSFVNILFSVYISTESKEVLEQRVLPSFWSRSHAIEAAELIETWYEQWAERVGAKKKEKDVQWQQMFS